MTALTTASVPAGVPQTLTLAGRSFVDRWRSTFWWGLGLVLIAVLQLSVYPSVARSSESMQAFIDEWPQPLQEAFGLEAYATGAGFLNAEMYSMVVPLVLIAMATAGAAAATAGEEEKGTADVLLSLPVSRTRVIVGKILATSAAVVLVAGLTWAAIAIGSPLVDLDVSLGNLAAATVATTLLALFFGAVSLLIGAVTGSRVIALGSGVALALAAFLLNALAPLADWLEPWQKVSPFNWALGDNPLVNGLDWGKAGLLFGFTMLLVVAADVVYHRHDIQGR